MSSPNARVKFGLLLLLAVMRPVGCEAESPAPPRNVAVTAHPELVTFGIDPRDYAAMANRLAASALASSRMAAAQGAVLVLGPVDTDGCPYPFDQVTLQEKLQTALHQAGRLEVSFAANVLPEASAQAALMRINRFNFDKEQSAAAEELRLLAATANIDFLLFGRLSGRETIVGDTVEVTYVFNWKIGDCRSGLLVWAEDAELTKRGRQASTPLWFEVGKMDSPVMRFALGHGSGPDAAQSMAAARKAALTALVAQANRSELVGLEQPLPFAADELAGAADLLASRTVMVGTDAWVMLRVPQALLAERLKLRTMADARWRELRDRVEEVRRLPKEKRRHVLLPLRGLMARFEEDFPLAAEHFVQPEAGWLAMAALESDLGNPWAARRWLTGVAEQSRSELWRRQANERLATMPPVGEADREVFILRRELEGRVVRLRCAWSEEGGNHPWAKAAAELQRWIEQLDAMALVEPVPASGDLRQFPVALTDEVLLVFTVTGKTATREAPEVARRPQFAFAGELWAAFGRKGHWHYPLSAQVDTGWTIFGPEMARDILALEAFKQWRGSLTALLAAVPEKITP